MRNQKGPFLYISPVMTALFLLLVCIDALCQTYYVKPDGPGLSGTSWSEAFSDLQEAIDSAQTGDQIWIAAGEYWPSSIFDTDSNGILEERERTYYINKNIEIIGGFEGNETSLVQRNSEINRAILSGDIGIHGDTTGATYHVLFIDGTSTTGSIDQECLIDGLTIDYGNSASNSARHQVGSAIYIKGDLAGMEASPSFKNCVIAENYGAYGGTIYIDGRYDGYCAPSFDHCIIEDNNTYGAGAVMCNGSFGNASANFSNCVFRNNFTTYAGGAIWCHNLRGICSLEIVNCYFERNESGSGGAIYSYCNQGTSFSKIIGSQFYQNKATLYGGAITNYDFQGNHISKIANCTFYKNSADHFGGALRNWRASSFLTNCILWDNGDEIDNIGTIETQLNQSTIDDGSPANGSISLPPGVTGMQNIDQNPLFIEPTGPNLRLSQNSPAINQGTVDTTGMNLPILDIDGYKRMVGQIDMGSFENPFSNCTQNIKITDLYSPLSGAYHAKQSIELSTGAYIPSPNQVILTAPEVKINLETTIEKGSSFEILLETCQE